MTLKPLPTPATGNRDLEKASLGARHVHALLRHVGVAEGQRGKLISELTGRSYAQSRRMLNEGVLWALEDLKRVADRFDISLMEMLALIPDDRWQDAVLIVGETRLCCRARIGSKVFGATTIGLVARISEGPPELTAALNLHNKESLRDVIAVYMDSANTPALLAARHRIAVLDDEKYAADILAASLCADGFDAEAVYTVSDLIQKDALQPFDGYVLDWKLGNNETAQHLLESIRKQKPAAPIVVFTGDDDVAEHQVAAVYALDFTFLSKPVKVAILASELGKKFGKINK